MHAAKILTRLRMDFSGNFDLVLHFESTGICHYAVNKERHKEYK